METSDDAAVRGANPNHPLDAIFINAPLRDYGLRPRVNDFTLPVLGMAYIATYAAAQGFNVGILDAEALGPGVKETSQLVDRLGPRWAGFNLLAPTYEVSASRHRSPSIATRCTGTPTRRSPPNTSGDSLRRLAMHAPQPRSLTHTPIAGHSYLNVAHVTIRGLTAGKMPPASIDCHHDQRMFVVRHADPGKNRTQRQTRADHGSHAAHGPESQHPSTAPV
ncbi:hypothetical protein [Frankia sp. Cj3]|uniref:hypothetical protein n=1 Tax=Frankia sp. Cj3 TaxID=2880976 RepID=UPI001EF54747|nr:hypothetical protein [Frankia sp. Cj3]